MVGKAERAMHLAFDHLSRKLAAHCPCGPVGDLTELIGRVRK